MLTKTQLWPAILLLCYLSACTTKIPKEISHPPHSLITISDIQSQPELYSGTSVRWGGIISQTEHSHQHTQLIIIAYSLNKQGRPIAGDHSEGRFVANIKGFLEPTVYNAERALTINGQVTGLQTINIGDFPYAHPVIDVTQFYLWPELPDEQDFDYYPYWWDNRWYYLYHPHPHRH